MEENNSKQEPENIIIDDKGKEIKPKKLNFFKKVWYSICKFEKYLEMSLEGAGRAFKYLIQIVSIFVLIISCIGLYNINKKLNSLVKNIEDNVPDFTYSEGKIVLKDSTESIYILQDKDFNLGKVIIDLSTEDEETISEYEKTIKEDSENDNMGLIILKDKLIQVVGVGYEGDSTTTVTYDEAMETLFGTSEVELTKAKLLEFLNSDGRNSIFIINFVAYFLAYFVIYLASGLIYVLILTIIGYASSKITKVKLKFSQVFAISIYAFTLSNILNMIYFIANYFAGIKITYFDVAYIAIAYIYMLAVLWLIKYDNIRKQENPVKEDKKEEKEEADGQEQI